MVRSVRCFSNPSLVIFLSTALANPRFRCDFYRLTLEKLRSVIVAQHVLSFARTHPSSARGHRIEAGLRAAPTMQSGHARSYANEGEEKRSCGRKKTQGEPLLWATVGGGKKGPKRRGRGGCQRICLELVPPFILKSAPGLGE